MTTWWRSRRRRAGGRPRPRTRSGPAPRRVSSRTASVTASRWAVGSSRKPYGRSATTTRASASRASDRPTGRPRPRRASVSRPSGSARTTSPSATRSTAAQSAALRRVGPAEPEVVGEGARAPARGAAATRRPGRARRPGRGRRGPGRRRGPPRRSGGGRPGAWRAAWTSRSPTGPATAVSPGAAKVAVRSARAGCRGRRTARSGGRRRGGRRGRGCPGRPARRRAGGEQGAGLLEGRGALGGGVELRADPAQRPVGLGARSSTTMAVQKSRCPAASRRPTLTATSATEMVATSSSAPGGHEGDPERVDGGPAVAVGDPPDRAGLRVRAPVGHQGRQAADHVEEVPRQGRQQLPLLVGPLLGGVADEDARTPGRAAGSAGRSAR